MLEVNALSIDFFTSRLARRNPIAYVRYGDGEFNAILGRAGENCDGHTYFPMMGQQLALTLTQPRHGNYMYGIGPKAARADALRDAVGAWLEVNAQSVVWNTSEVFLHASLEGTFLPLMDGLRKRKVLWLAPQHMTHFLQHEPSWLHWTAPSKNAWLAKDELRAALVWQLSQHPLDAVVFCAGMVSKILIWELFPQWGRKVHLWDMGSVFDMYCGVDSRSYARRMRPAHKEHLLRVNFKMETAKGVEEDANEQNTPAPVD